MRKRRLVRILVSLFDGLMVVLILILLGLSVMTVMTRRQGSLLLGAAVGSVQSNSMAASGLYRGDMVLIHRKPDYQIGDIIAFYYAPQQYETGTAEGNYPVWFHQITEKSTTDGRTAYRTKGTSNAADDGFWVPEDFVLGVGSKLPELPAKLLGFVATARGVILLVILPTSILLVYLIYELAVAIRERRGAVKEG